jgi:2-isopropylmalate synthase
MATITIFDTTLRDGEQAPGWSMNLEEKLAMARMLQRLRVDVIEAGFPSSSPGDFESVRRVAETIEGPSIAGLARCVDSDIDRCWEAVRACQRPRIHIFLATSPIHMTHKLRMTPDQVLRTAVRATQRAAGYTENVEFSCEDATRSDRGFLTEIVQAVVEAGATTVNIPDTVGYTVPEEYGALIRHLGATVRGMDRAVLSVHCHNDLGLAVANSLAAVAAGARQVECTINGIGERAGNASLEELVMALRTRRDVLSHETSIDATHLVPASRLLSRLTGVAVQPNKAIVGANAFAHEAGIHQDGVLKHVRTYEIMTPESVGLESNRLVLGKHSGRHAFRERLLHLGYNLADTELDAAFRRFKKLADKKKSVYDEDLEALVADAAAERGERPFELVYLNVSCGNLTVPTATVQLRVGDELRQDAGFGDGPVDAVFQTLRKLTGIETRLLSYSVSAVTGGEDAQGGAHVVLEVGGEEMSGHGTHTDVIVASALAYLQAVSKFVIRRARQARSASSVASA